ncbi:MAG: hypothetical protein ETSY1_41670 [Candidatus Entotheonella factor]|uniref:Uncharacterized protein n=1 Tax=Entotheonella factor TaxID=1429438 RepID=W4L471_ENTF1|nr:hypothetical protein [Candidatus Entotheonella palauensis]ETW92888.1 MAG: hypothetical protein ETSY1_41670 [Candidatus Entotheonella factor]
MLKMILPMLVVLFVWSTSDAVVITQCIPEPTDMEIEFGDTFTCEFETLGDTDVFHFSGQVGDTIAAGVAEVSGNSIFDPCITLTAPNGETTDGCGDDVMTRIDATLVQEGTYTITVRDAGDNAVGIYEVTLACLGGPCSVPTGDPEIAVTPPNADFGAVGLTSESAPLMFLIKNDLPTETGIGPRLRIEPITLDGTNADDFSIRNDECSNRSIPPGLRCYRRSGVLTQPSRDQDGLAADPVERYPRPASGNHDEWGRGRRRRRSDWRFSLGYKSGQCRVYQPDHRPDLADPE